MTTPFLSVPVFSYPSAPAGQLFTYVAGTTTLKVTYSDAAGTVPNTNPVILDSNGLATVRLGSGAYDFVLYDQTGLTTIWSALDYIQGPYSQADVVALLGADPITRQTATELAQSITPTALQYKEGDIRRYGALITATDNSAAISTALLISANGGAPAFIPSVETGTQWKITSTITAPGSCSMYGVGKTSLIVATGCDGITFGIPTFYGGSQFFRDFMIQGSSTTTSTNNGIVCNIGTSVANAKVIGIEFSNLTIQNFNKAVYVNGQYGLWNCSFNDCFLYNNYQGYYFLGQSVVTNIRGGVVQTGSITGTGTRYGFFAQDSGGGNTQSLHMGGVSIYGYDINIALTNTVYVAIEDCDLSVYNTCGIQSSGHVGMLSIRDCWIQAAAGINNFAGIFLADLGSAQFDKAIIDGCTLQGGTGTGSCGIYCGNNQGPVSITNNSIGTSSAPFVIGIGGNTPAALGASAVGTGGMITNGTVIKFNTIYANTTASLIYSSASDVECGPNVTQHGTPVAFSTASTPPGFRYYIAGMKGTATFASSTSAVVTLTNAMPNAGYFISLGGNAAGFTWPVSKATTGFTINCNASNSNPTDWQINY